MDAAQKLICKEIGTDESYQSVLKSEKKTLDPFSFRSSLTRSSRESIRFLYKHYVADGGEQIVTFLPVQNNQTVTIVDLLRSPTP